MADTTSDDFVVNQALRKWVIAVLGLPEAQVICEPFSKARPTKAYVGVEFVSDVSQTEAWLEQHDDEMRGAVPKLDQYQLRFYGEDLNYAPAKMQRSLALPAIQMLLTANNITVVNTAIVHPGDIVRDKVRWEIGRILEVGVSYVSIDEDATDVVLVEIVDVAASPAPLYGVTIEPGA